MSLRKRISLEGQKIIEGAFNDLKDALSTTDFVQLKDTTLDDVQQAMYKVEEGLSARGVVRNLRRLLPLISGLGHYSKTIEVLCNGTPFLPWIWAPIKLILKVSSENLDAFEQIIRTYARIAEPLSRFKTYNATYSKDLNVQKALSLFYADILRFHKNAYNLIQRGGWYILFATSCGRFQRQFQHIFDDLKAHEDLIDKTANAAGLSDIRSLWESVQSEQEARKEAAARKEEELVASQLAQLVTLLRVDDSHQLDVLETILSEAGDAAGSGGWALRQARIKSWASRTEQTKFLVVHGHPGTGKSVLSARIARFLQAPPKAHVIAHFCTYLYPESTRYEDILRFILIRLIRRSPELITYVHHDLLVRKLAPSAAVLEQLLIRLLSAASLSHSQTTYIHLIVDGLSECPESAQVRASKFLQKLVASVSGQTVLKVLLVTRTHSADSPISKVLKGKHQVSLADEKSQLREDIKLFVESMLGTLRPKLGQLSLGPQDTDFLSTQIVNRADGMILWAKLVLQSIASEWLASREEVFEAAKSFPRELSQLYGQILSRLTARLNERSVNRLRSTLGWIAFARRPLRQSELLSALSFSAGDQDVKQVMPAYILDECAPLVEQRTDTTYRFIHVSVLEFLQISDSPVQLTKQLVLHEHGITTIQCLLEASRVLHQSYPEDERVRRLVKGVYSFLLYAADFWLDGLMHEVDASSQAGFDRADEFLRLSANLATNLGPDATPSPALPQSSPFNSLLETVQRYDAGLLSMTRAAVAGRIQTSLDPVKPQALIDILEPRSVEQLKTTYQMMIRELLARRTCGHITMTEFEWFKHEARQGAFTCRLPSCPYATAGFEDERSLADHEAEHRAHICTHPGCQYPPFDSLNRLKQHVKQHHASPSTPKQNRQSVRIRAASGGTAGPQKNLHQPRTSSATTVASNKGTAQQENEQEHRSSPRIISKEDLIGLGLIQASDDEARHSFFEPFEHPTEHLTQEVATDPYIKAMVSRIPSDVLQYMKSFIRASYESNTSSRLIPRWYRMCRLMKMMYWSQRVMGGNVTMAYRASICLGWEGEVLAPAATKDEYERKVEQLVESWKRMRSVNNDADAAPTSSPVPDQQAPSSPLRAFHRDMDAVEAVMNDENNTTSRSSPVPQTPVTPAPRTPVTPVLQTPATQAEPGEHHSFKDPQVARTAAEDLARLQSIGMEEQRLFKNQAVQYLVLRPDDLQKTKQALNGIVGDIAKIGRGLIKWYQITHDDDRARAFFRMRLTVMSHFSDDELMTNLRGIYSIDSADVARYRYQLETMARDLTRSVFGRSAKATKQEDDAPAENRPGLNAPDRNQMSLDSILSLNSSDDSPQTAPKPQDRQASLDETYFDYSGDNWFQIEPHYLSTEEQHSTSGTQRQRQDAADALGIPPNSPPKSHERPAPKASDRDKMSLDSILSLNSADDAPQTAPKPQDQQNMTLDWEFLLELPDSARELFWNRPHPQSTDHDHAASETQRQEAADALGKPSSAPSSSHEREASVAMARTASSFYTPADILSIRPGVENSNYGVNSSSEKPAHQAGSRGGTNLSAQLPAGLAQQVAKALAETEQQPQDPTWQTLVPLADRLSKVINLINTIRVSAPALVIERAVHHSVNLERQHFTTMQSEELYNQAMTISTAEFSKAGDNRSRWLQLEAQRTRKMADLQQTNKSDNAQTT